MLAVQARIGAQPQILHRRRSAPQHRVDGRAGVTTHLVQRSGVDHASAADDADPVGQFLGLAEDVGRQQDAAAAGLLLGDLVLEHRLHERIQAGGRLVHDQQVDVG